MIVDQRLLLSLAWLLTVSLPAWAVDVPLPGDSIYQLQVPLINHDGRPSNLIDRRGRPLLISMFYTGCQFVCPRIIDALKKTSENLTPNERRNMPILMVTFDPARDDLAALQKVVDERNLDTQQWTLARTDDRHVRKLSAALGIQYMALPNGDFNHTSVLILLDGEGRIVAKTSTIGVADSDFVLQVKKAAKQTTQTK